MLDRPLSHWVSRCILPLWRLYDALVPKRADYWAFSTHHIRTTEFVENQRAVFEQVKADPALTKVLFYRGDALPAFGIDGAVNFQIIRHGTWRSLLMLARCGVVLLTHSICMDYSLRWRDGRFQILKLVFRRRTIVNLWHGIPIKRLLHASNADARRHTDRIPYRQVERRYYAGLIASSEHDALLMAAMFYPLHYQQVWATGLPKNDFLSMRADQLPRYLRESIASLRSTLRGRRLVLYAPTYRQSHVASSAHYYQFEAAEIGRLKDVLERHDAVLGYRPHYFRNSEQYFNLDQFIDGHRILDLSQAIVPELAALTRECDVLVTDYSSVVMDTMYLQKPAICFAYDLASYRNDQDGVLYEPSVVFRQPVCTTFSEVLEQLDSLLARDRRTEPMNDHPLDGMFFTHRDADNAARAVLAIKGHAGLR